MSEFKLCPGDILVNVNRRQDPFSVVKRWAMNSPYDHIFMYLGKVQIFATLCQREIRIPLLFESFGRGCSLRSLSERYGQEVVILRLKSEHDRERIPYVLWEAIRLASDERARYDYWCIASFIIPRILAQKLHLPLPLKYDRDPFMVCSEAVMEVFLRGRVEILPPDIVPLPEDFLTAPLLDRVYEGTVDELLT